MTIDPVRLWRTTGFSAQLAAVHCLRAGAAPRILKWEGQNRIRERSERKIFFLYPPLFQLCGVHASEYQYNTIQYCTVLYCIVR